MPPPLNTTGDLGGKGAQLGGRRGASVKTLKRMLKKAGLKVSGKKSTLTRRAKKAHLKMRGGAEGGVPEAAMGGRRRSRRRGGAEGSCSDPTKTKEEDCVAPETWTPSPPSNSDTMSTGGRRRRRH